MIVFVGQLSRHGPVIGEAVVGESIHSVTLADEEEESSSGYLAVADMRLDVVVGLKCLHTDGTTEPFI